MDETDVNTENTDVELSFKHQLGKQVVGGLAAFAADHLAGKAYDAILRARRARKSS